MIVYALVASDTAEAYALPTFECARSHILSSTTALKQ
jgi:hypothetical protein